MIFRSFVIIYFFIFGSFCIYSQSSFSNKIPAGGDTTLVIPDEFGSALDNMLHSWAIKRAVKSNCQSSEVPPVISDSICKLRLSKLPYLMEMPYNSTVRSYIDLYTIKKRRQMESMLGMSEYYFPVFEQVLGANNLPLELKYLSIIESALNTTIVSRMGAAGLWQLMIATGKMYGLEVNSLVDERLSPVKATNAAARFMKDLHSIYGDWNLVIAAYNCGPGNVNKAIRKAGGKRDYWAIYPFLPRETRGYVPIFIAANYSMHYAKEHNICPATVNMPAVTDTVMVRKRISLVQVASVLNLPLELVRLLNPQYRKDIIPGNIKPYSLCLPQKYVNKYLDLQDSILAYKADSLVNDRRDVIEILSNSPSSSSNNGGNAKLHKVLRGQTLKSIAAKYGISTTKLKMWNNIKTSTVKVGSYLKVSQPTSQNMMDKEETPAAAKVAEDKQNANTALKYHTVEKGQNLFAIATKYGVTVEELQLWNSMASANVKVGDKICLSKPGDSKSTADLKSTDTDKDKKAKQSIAKQDESLPKYHIVKKKESLLSLASKYDVTVDDIKKWNNLHRNSINIGDKIIVSKSGIDPEKTETKIVEKNNKVADKSKASNEQITKAEDFEIIHKIEKGQTLQAIATKYSVTVDKIKKWNPKLNDRKLNVGDAVKVITNSSLAISKVEVAAVEVKKSEKQQPTPVEVKQKKQTADSEVNAKEHIVTKGQSLISIAAEYGMTVESLKELNKLSTTHLEVGQKLNVVQSTTANTVVKSTKAPKSEEAESVSVQKSKTVSTAHNEKELSHIVTKGQSLASIASIYHVTVDELKEWNDLSSSRLDVGDEVKIKASSTDKTSNKKSDTLEKSEEAVSTKSAKKSDSKPKPKYHTVSRGQNLGAIANRYGITVDEIKAWNNMSDTKLSIGDKLKVSKR